MRGNNSFIHNAQKKRNGQSDTEQLIDIASYLRKKYKVNVKREPYLIFDLEDKLVSVKESVTKADLNDHYAKNPDLLWFDKYGLWIIEVDGRVHLRKSEKTQQRNELFIKNRIKLIVVSLYEFNMKEFNIFDYIDKRIMEIING